MNIVLAASEGVPYCKTGGLADVIGALGHALARAGHRVLVFLPLYRSLDRKKHRIKYIGPRFDVRISERPESVELWAAPAEGNVQTIFVRADFYFNRDGLYGPRPGEDYADNHSRFIVFSQAVVEATKHLDFAPDIIHAHDWQTGLVPPYMKIVYGSDTYFSRCASVFTAHNMVYQGLFPLGTFVAAGFPLKEFHPDRMEFYGQLNFLKAGFVYADAITTVSPGYAREILTDPEFGCGLEGVLGGRRNRFRGILNGLDTDAWNPATDPHIAERFTAPTRSARTACKRDLQKKAGLPENESIPVLGFVGRLDPQKGIETILDIAPRVLKGNRQMVILGSGDARYQALLREMERAFPSKLKFESGFAEPLAHQIYAGSDVFMMPSRYEPCGLGQMIAMRYGAVPVVTPTGGLNDTVIDASRGRGTGFISTSRTAGSYRLALEKALKTMKSKRRWDALQQNAMSTDNRWERSIPEYLKMYRAAIRWRLE